MRSQAVSGVAWRRRLEGVLSKKTSAREVDGEVEVEVELVWGMRIVYWFLSQAQAPWSSVIVFKGRVVSGSQGCSYCCVGRACCVRWKSWGSRKAWRDFVGCQVRVSRA